MSVERLTRQRGALGLAAGLALAGGVIGPTATAAAATAAAASQSVSANWAGYVVERRDGSAGFSSVSGSWLQPTAHASASDAYSAFWVGLGGSSSSSSSLEQVGTESDWVDGRAVYTAWYELVPAASVRLRLTIRAGDRMRATVKVSGATVTVGLADRTTGRSVTKTLYMRSPDTSSAEWIAEAPSTATPGGSYATLPLADFGTVAFDDASATSDGHTGSIADAAWSSDRVQLRTEGGAGGGFGGGPPDAVALDSASGARTSTLRAGGAGFAVAWRSGSAAAA